MINFLKNLGKGILYVLVFPVLIIGLAVYAVVAFFMFFYLAIKGLILFFTGRSLFEDLPEDIEAKRRLTPAAATQAQPQQQANESVFVNSTPIVEANNDPFYVPEYLREPEEEQVEEEIEEESPSPEPIPEPTFVEQEQPENQEEDVVLVKKSSQNTTIFEVSDLDDDDHDNDDSSGINIDFE